MIKIWWDEAHCKDLNLTSDNRISLPCAFPSTMELPCGTELPYCTCHSKTLLPGLQKKVSLLQPACLQMQTDYFCYIVESIFDEGRLNSWIFFWPSLIHRFVSTLVDPGFWQTNSRLCLLPDLMNNYLHRDFLEVPLSRRKCLWVLKYVSFSGEKNTVATERASLRSTPCAAAIPAQSALAQLYSEELNQTPLNALSLSLSVWFPTTWLYTLPHDIFIVVEKMIRLQSLKNRKHRLICSIWLL